MADSEILKFQDTNGDGLIDICDVALPRDEQRCLECKPNPSAIVPRWRNTTNPFLNEKICKFQYTYTTPYTTTGGEDAKNPTEADEILQQRSKEFQAIVVDEFITYYNKELNPDTVSQVLANLEYTEYDLAATASSHLKFLYSVPFDILNNLESAEDDSEEEEEIPGEDISVTYIPNILQRDMIRVRKGLHLYNSNLKVYRAMDGKNLLFEDGGVFNLGNYGDFVLFGESTMARIVPELGDFFRQFDFTLGNASPFFPAREAIYKFECTFSPEYEIKKIKVWTEACKEKPYQIGKRKLKSLNRKQAFKDPTAMAYFARISKMERDLTARRPKPWVDFLVEYTYPQIYDTATRPPQELSAMGEALSCVGENLQNEMKQLGQDLMDEVFGIGDAIAAQFHKMICDEEYQDVLLNEYIMGKHDTKTEREEKKANNRKRRKNVRAKALEQALGDLEDKDIIMTNLCARLLVACGGPGSQRKIDSLWSFTLDPLRLCGLFDLMTDLLQCLMKGMTFEQLLASVIRSALKAMSIENFGDLFIGLPPEKQAELDALVKRKLESGDISGPGRALDNTSNAIESGAGPSNPPFFGKVKIDKPWNNPEIVERQKTEMSVEGGYDNMTPTGIPPKGGSESQLSKATYAAQFADADAGLSPNVIMEAYMIALIDVYSDNLMALLEELNKFPGAEMIAKVIATLDCPRPPLFDPSLMDFLKDLELPFCRNAQHIGLPRMDNPFAYLPKIWDIFRILFWIAIQMLHDLVIRLICKLMIFICEKISDAICKALELAGSLAAAAVSGGRTTFADAIRDTLCGPGADQDQVENTIEDLFKQIGQGGAQAAGDRQSLMNFVEDLSATTSRLELTNAILGEPSSTFLDMVDGLVEFEHPAFRTMFPNGDQAASFFTNVGNLMPVEARAAMRDLVDRLPEDDEMPANPTLCASEEDLDNFCAVRASILEGRASSEQIKELCDNTRDTFTDDFEQVADLFQGGIPKYFEDNMPPIMSSGPNCDDGLVPYEPSEIAKAQTSALGGSLEILEIAYAQDMLGNGPGRNNWGFVNMVLADTMGNPYTTHIRKSFNSGGFLSKKKFVDFYVDTDEADEADDANYAKTRRQRGALPSKVAGYLQTQLETLADSSTYELNNSKKSDKKFTKTFKDLDLGGLFDDVDLTELPNFGYNVDVNTDYDAKIITFTRKARKADADLKLTYQDRAAGRLKSSGNPNFLYGFDIEMFLTDVFKDDEDGSYYNRPDDNARIIIRKKINTKYKGPGAGEYDNDEEKADEKSDNSGAKVLKYAAYEFISTDNGLNLDSNLFENNDYALFLQTLQAPVSDTPPQLVLLSDMIAVENGTTPGAAALKSTHNSFMKSLLKLFASEIANNNNAFNYGAVFDNITEEQMEYGVSEGASFTPMKDYLDNNDLSARDAPFGMSRMQHDNPETNQVFYLNPTSYGGTNLNPPVYLKPADKNGWLSIVDAMFPELSPCKPSKTNLVDFGQIQDMIDETYNKIPEDKRLKSDPDCVKEKPYNRILERSSKAGIEGLIHAACRIFVSQNFLKSLATFTKFYPDFRNSFSSIYASYIVEIMEEELKEAQANALFAAFNPFKDDEFWYAFLEQSVQTYARKVADGDIENPPADVVRALTYLEEFEKNYRYPYRKRLRTAKDTKETGPFKTLRNYRYERNLEAIKESEDYAKLVLKEFVIQEMEYMASIFMRNLEEINLVKPSTMVKNLDYYILQNLSVNNSLDLQKEIKEVPGGSISDREEGIPYYTSGQEFTIESSGEQYTGWYHMHVDEMGDPVFMVGEFHSEEPHEKLRPFANKLIVPIGDIMPIGTASGTAEKPFVTETYIKVDGTYYTPSAALSIIMANDGATNLHSIYPGTMTVIADPETDEPVGIEGEMGVRYGLRLSITAAGSKHTLIETEVDALDLPISEFAPLEANSKLLFCLLNNLVDDEKFKMLTSYIFPANKILSLLAIYNDMGFLPSIGENTTTLTPGGWTETPDVDQKPGMYAEIDEDGVVTLKSGGEDEEDSGPGPWALAEERWPGPFRGNGLFGLHFDKWDRRVLPRSKTRLKKLFKNYYNQREFQDPSGEKVGRSAATALAEAFKFSPGERHFPWFKKRLLRSNPFDKNGNMCKK